MRKKREHNTEGYDIILILQCFKNIHVENKRKLRPQSRVKKLMKAIKKGCGGMASKYTEIPLHHK